MRFCVILLGLSLCSTLFRLLHSDFPTEELQSYLAEHGHAIPESLMSSAFLQACNYSQPRHAAVFLGSFKETVPRGFECMKKAVERLDHELVKILLEDGRVDPSLEEKALVYLAFEKRNLAMLKILLEDPRLNGDGVMAYTLLEKVLDGNFTPTWIEGIMNLRRVDPTLNENELLRSYSLKGDSGALTWLLTDPRVDPSFSGYEAVLSTAHRGNYTVLELFLSDNRVVLDDPQTQTALSTLFLALNSDLRILKTLAFVLACKRNEMESVPRLFKEATAILRSVGRLLNIAGRLALNHGYDDLLRWVLNRDNYGNPYANPKFFRLSLMKYAAARGLSLEVLFEGAKLGHEDLDEVMEYACKFGHLETVKYLLEKSKSLDALLPVVDSCFGHCMTYCQLEITKKVLHDYLELSLQSPLQHLNADLARYSEAGHRHTKEIVSRLHRVVYLCSLAEHNPGLFIPMDLQNILLDFTL